MALSTTNKSNTTSFEWGGGTSSPLLAKCEEGEKVVVLDFEHDHERINEELGGRVTYTSRSGDSGAGYIARRPQACGYIPAGIYRRDVSRRGLDTNKGFTVSVELEGGVWLYLPYSSHRGVCQGPAVLVDSRMVGTEKVVFFNLRKMKEVVMAVLVGTTIESRPSKLEKDFMAERIVVQVYDLYDEGPRDLNPWSFVAASGLLKKYSVEVLGASTEPPYGDIGMAILPDGRVAKTEWIGGEMFATRVFKEDPCSSMISPPTGCGWEGSGRTNVLLKSRGSFQVIAWKPMADILTSTILEMVEDGLIQKDEAAKAVSFLDRTVEERYIVVRREFSPTLYALGREEILSSIEEELRAKARDCITWAIGASSE